MTQNGEQIRSFERTKRAFRAWAGSLPPARTPEVYGANAQELQLLAALGGLAAELAREHLDRWPAECRRWALSAPPPPAAFVEEVGLELGAREDVLAALYNACISSTSRRSLGTVFTPQPVVDHMIDLVDRELADPRPVIVDPGAGVGAFCVSAALRWPESTTIAVDVNPVTLGLLGTRLAFEIDADPERAKSYEAIELRLENYLDLVTTLYGDRDSPIVVLGNPPYTRVQQLPREERRKAWDLTAGIIDSGHANLATLIQAMTLGHMRSQDLSCMLLPASFTYTRAGRGLRRRLWDSERPISVERWPAAHRLFIGHSVQAAIVSIGPRRADLGPVNLASVEVFERKVREIDSRSLRRDDAEPKDWFGNPEIAPTGETVALSSLAKVRRGIATGANEMFFLDDATAARFPRKMYVAGIQSLRDFAGEDLDPEQHRQFGGPNGRRWLLAIPPSAALAGAIKAYVDGFEGTVKSRYLPSERSPWYSLRLAPPPPILVAPLSKGRFQIVANKVAAIPSNNLFGIYPTKESDVDRISDWLRSSSGQSELRRVSRRYPGGSYKLEPKALGTVRLPRDGPEPFTQGRFPVGT